MIKEEGLKLNPRAPKAGWGKIVRGTSKHLKGNMLRVYCELIGYADEHGKCWPSKETIAEGAGIDVGSIRKITKTLEDAGWLTRFERPNNSNLYQMYYPEAPKKKEQEKQDGVLEEISEGANNDSTEGVKNASSEGVVNTSQRDQYKIPYKETNTLTNSSEFEDVYFERFDDSEFSELISTQKNIDIYNRIKDAILEVSQDNSVKRWTMSSRDEDLIEQLKSVERHLVGAKLDYGIKKATRDNVFRFGDIVAHAIATNR